MASDEIKAISEFIEEHGWNVVGWEDTPFYGGKRYGMCTPIFNFRSWMEIDDNTEKPKHSVSILDENVAIDMVTDTGVVLENIFDGHLSDPDCLNKLGVALDELR